MVFNEKFNEELIEEFGEMIDSSFAGFEQSWALLLWHQYEVIAIIDSDRSLSRTW